MTADDQAIDEIVARAPRMTAEQAARIGQMFTYIDTDAIVSHACEFPADQQAELIPADMTRRHPWIGRRPAYSGYCVVPCQCECHQAQTGELAEEVRLDVFES